MKSLTAVFILMLATIGVLAQYGSQSGAYGSVGAGGSATNVYLSPVDNTVKITTNGTANFSIQANTNTMATLGSVQLQIQNATNQLSAAALVGRVPHMDGSAYYDNNKTFCITNWGAYCDGSNAVSCGMVAGSVTLTNLNGAFTSADMNKWIDVQLANSNHLDLVCQITNILATNQIQISLAAVNNVTNVTARYGHDDTLADQAALNFIVSTNGGGTLLIPAATIIAGQLQDVGLWTNHHNAQIIIPSIAPNGTHAPKVVLEGPDNEGIDNGIPASPQQQSTYGGQLWSFLPWADTTNHASLFDGRNFANPTTYSSPGVGGYSVPMSSVTLEVRNLCINVCYDANIRALNMEGQSRGICQHVEVQCGYTLQPPPYPPSGVNGVGIFMPGFFNNNEALLFDFKVGQGFYNGICIADNARILNGSVFGAVNGLVWPNGEGGDDEIHGANFQVCSNVLANTSGFNAQLSGHFAVYQAGQWMGTNWNLIVDPNLSLYTGGLFCTIFSATGGDAYPQIPNYVGTGRGGGITIVSQTGLQKLTHYSQVVFRSGLGPTRVLDTASVDIGADVNSNSITPNAPKYGSIGFPEYATNDYVPLISSYSYSAAGTRLYLGGDDQKAYSGRMAASEIEFFSSSNSTATPSMMARLDSTGFYPYFSNPKETIGTTAWPWYGGYYSNLTIMSGGSINGNGSGLSNLLATSLTGTITNQISTPNPISADSYQATNAFVTNQFAGGIWQTNSSTVSNVFSATIFGTAANNYMKGLKDPSDGNFYSKRYGSWTVGDVMASRDTSGLQYDTGINVAQLTNGVTGYTNGTAPVNTTTPVAWINFTNLAGGVFKMPLYQ